MLNPLSHAGPPMWYLKKKNVYLFLRERERELEREKGRKKEGQGLQTGSALTAVSPVRSSNSRTVSPMVN